jgi:hypothetical protein
MTKSEYANPITGIVIILVLGMSLVTAAAVQPGISDSVGEFKDWCDGRDGDLYNSQAMGEHAGLHCELPNGTSIHMHEVVQDDG